jgi:Sulfotransferase domain
MNSIEKIQATQQLFLNERLLINGQHQSSSTHQSIIFYSTAKGGSTYVSDLLRQLVEDVEITPINFSDYCWQMGESMDAIKNKVVSNQGFKPVGYCYGCFRDIRLWTIPELDRYKILLVLRDPRDVMTSLYFSIAVSHKIPTLNQHSRKKMLLFKITALKMNIDDYVLESIPRFLEKYQDYIHYLYGKPNVVFLTYEEMVGHFGVWLDKVITGLELDVSPQLVDRIKSEANFTVDREDIYSHKRQVQPGDHKRKLKPETIEILNDRFAEVLETLGYDRD